MSLADVIKAAREKKGWSQEDLHAASGVKLNTIRTLEQGNTNPKLQTIGPVADALGVKLDRLWKEIKKEIGQTEEE